MSHKLLEKIDDIVADNRITEDEYITICSLLKDMHSQKNDVLINDLREQIEELKYSINWYDDERNEMIDHLNATYKSREVMENLNRQLHKDLKNLREEMKQNIVEIKQLKNRLSATAPDDEVKCCCGSVIKRSGLSRHLKTIKHRAYIGEL